MRHFMDPDWPRERRRPSRAFSRKSVADFLSASPLHQPFFLPPFLTSSLDTPHLECNNSASRKQRTHLRTTR